MRDSMRNTTQANGGGRGGRRRRAAGGFSLIELVIVVVIIAIISAIAIPKMSRGAAGANESALAGDLATLRSALELYAQEHGGNYPAGANIKTLMLGYSAVDGTQGSPTTTRTSTYMYGPYLKAFPALPVGGQHGQSDPVFNATGVAQAGTTTSAGWLYDGTTFYANDVAGDVDSNGHAYNGY